MYDGSVIFISHQITKMSSDKNTNLGTNGCEYDEGFHYELS